MTVTCELAEWTRIRAYRAQQYVLIIAEGELPTPGFDVDITRSPFLIFPPQFNVMRCPRPGIWPQHVTPYRYAETVQFPADQPTVTVHHAGGIDQVDIEPCGAELSSYAQALSGDADRQCPPGADETTGFSRNLSFDEAFANARANLPPFTTTVADALETIRVVEIGGLFGGFAGFNDLFVRICRTRLSNPGSARVDHYGEIDRGRSRRRHRTTRPTATNSLKTGIIRTPTIGNKTTNGILDMMCLSPTVTHSTAL